MKKTIVINLFGSPGTGKSTTAAGLFFELKTRGISCELVNEYAKSMVWREASETEWKDQLLIFAQQNAKMEHLRGKVDFIITDCPLLLSAYYAPTAYFSSTFPPLVHDVWNSYENFNVWLDRVKPYDPTGRNQTEEESDQVAKELHNMVAGKIDYAVNANADAPLFILEQLPLHK